MDEYVITKKYRLGSLATVKRAMSAPKQPLLTEGTKVTDKGTKEVGVVEAVHQTNPEKVDVVFEGEEEAKTVKVADLIVEKKPRVLNVSVGTLVFFEDMHGKGAEYVYKGDLKFTRTETPTLIQAKREARWPGDASVCCGRSEAAAHPRGSRCRGFERESCGSF